MSEPKIGFIGLGVMGGGMAANILAAGYDLTIHNRTREKAAALIDLGARFAATPSGLSQCDIVFTMVSDDAALRAVCYEGGLLDALPENAIHVASSTISIELAEELKAEHARRGQTLVGAPVSGRGDAAADGTLFVISAGDASALERCAGVFDAIGQKTLDFGRDPSMAFVCKLGVNAMIANAIASISESYRLVEAWGVDPKAFHDFVTGGLLSAPSYKTYGAQIATNTHAPAVFNVHLGLKDVRLAIQAGEAKAVQMPAAASMRNLLNSAIAQGHGALDWTAVFLAAYPGIARSGE